MGSRGIGFLKGGKGAKRYDWQIQTGLGALLVFHEYSTYSVEDLMS